MSKQPANKIADAVEICLSLALAVGKSGPFKRVAAYLNSLKKAVAWSDAEVMEVQTRVIRAIMKRIEAAE